MGTVIFRVANGTVELHKRITMNQNYGHGKGRGKKILYTNDFLIDTAAKGVTSPQIANT